MRKITLLPLLLLFVPFSLFSQNLNKYIEQQQVVSYQKVYLHTDRDFYFYGDTLWFASYLIDGHTHIPSKDSCNLYVELINTKGEITQKDIFPIENGICPGYLSFAENDFKEGNYLLRAYTDYLKNFGDNSFFEKTIKLSETKNSNEVLERTDSIIDSARIDIQFFPEGGFLLANQLNLVAFKVINEKGRPIEVKGKINDENGNFICSFNSTYQGMGKFHFTPIENSTYNIEIEGHPDLHPILPDIRTTGSKVIITKADNNDVRFKIITSEEKSKKPFFIALMHRGKETFFLELEGDQINKIIQVETDSLKEGINQIVLLNDRLEPLSERMVFINQNNDIQLKVKLNQGQYKTREKVNIQINSTFTKEIASLSVAVVNEGALKTEGNTQNIKSYLLIDSELNGPIPSPADFFINDEILTSQSKLDLLMLSNGWKNYIWNNLKKEDVAVKYEPSLGVNLKGKVLKQSGNKSFDKAKVVLSVNSKTAIDFYSTIPNKKGNYEFENIQVYDTASIFLQGKNQRNNNNTYLELDSFNYSAPINPEKIKLLKSYSSIPISFYRLNYFNDRTIKEFYPDKNTRIMEDVVVTAEKPEVDDGHHRIYAKPKVSFDLKVTDMDYSNLFEYLRVKTAGVFIQKIAQRRYKVVIGGPTYTGMEGKIVKPLYLLDGMQTTMERLADLQMAEVDKVEVLKRNEAAIYGTRGAGGVLSVWTKMGEVRDPESIVVPGTLVKQIKGFAPYREFYSPKYTAKNIELEVPDLRTTLYWNPKVSLKDGKANISFFTCDNVARYKIFVEGISESGKIYLGCGVFEVDRHRNNNDESKEPF